MSNVVSPGVLTAMPSAKVTALVQRFIFVVVEGVLHAGRTRGLHAVDLYLGAQALDGERHAGDQAAAADRHDDRVHIGQLVEDFETNRSLALQ